MDRDALRGRVPEAVRRARAGRHRARQEGVRRLAAADSDGNQVVAIWED